MPNFINIARAVASRHIGDAGPPAWFFSQFVDLSGTRTAHTLRPRYPWIICWLARFAARRSLSGFLFISFIPRGSNQPVDILKFVGGKRLSQLKRFIENLGTGKTYRPLATRLSTASTMCNRKVWLDGVNYKDHINENLFQMENSSQN